MDHSLFNSTEGVLFVILALLAFAFWAQKFKWGKLVGPSLIVILLGILLRNTGVVPAWNDVYGIIVQYCIPISISLMMLSVDFNQLKKLNREPVIALASAVLSVSVMAFLFGLIFGNKIDEGWKISGMFVGTYTGGSANLTAIAVGLNASSSTIAAANAADYVVGIPTLILMFATPAILKGSKWFNKVWPYHHTEQELIGDEDGGLEMTTGDKKEWSIKDLSMLLCISMLINLVSISLSNAVFPETFANAGKILLITTFSVLVAQIPFIKKLKGKLDLGIFFAMMYLCIIGFMVDIQGFLSSTLSITIFCLCVVLACTVLHLLVTRALKIRYEFVILSIVAAIADGTTSALVATNGKWKSLIPIGLLCGILGSILGNYFGVAVAYLVKAVIGA